MDEVETARLSFAVNAIRQLLSTTLWLESMMPVYHFMIDDIDLGWTPRSGFQVGKPQSPTCILSISQSTITELLQGKHAPRTLQQKGLIRLGGLLSDAVALSKIFLPEDEKLSRWKSLFSEQGFSSKMFSTEGRRLQVELMLPALQQIEDKYARRLDSIRNVLNSWVEHKISKCRLNQWVRFDFDGLGAEPWEDPGALDIITTPAFAEMRQEAMAFLDGSVRAPHYGGSDSAPDTPAVGQPFGWRSYNIIEHFRWRTERAERFPATSAVLKQIAAGHTIAHAGFLIMEGSLDLLPHCDGANWLLSYQFGLIVPENCYLQVVDERRFHKEGHGLVFNDSFLHSAANGSTQTRVLLAVLYANPQLSEMEREAMVTVASNLPSGAIVYAN